MKDKTQIVNKMKTRVNKIKSESCLNKEGRLESITFDGIYEAIELLCDFVEYTEYSIKEKKNDD